MKPNYFFAAFAFMSLTVLATQASTTAPTKNSLLIRNAYIISPDAELSKTPLNILIEHDRISAIGTEDFKADQIIEARGQYLIPGLIDTHVHLRDVPGLMVPENERANSTLYQEAAAQIPKSYLYAGFTTLLDLANSKEFIDQWNSNTVTPQAYFCSPVLIPHGYPVANLPEAVQASPLITSHLLDDRHSHSAATTLDADKHSPVNLVQTAKKDGARCMKVFYETGFGNQHNLPVPSEAIIRELVAAAHKEHLPVFLHGNSQRAYEFALNTGVDMLVHGMWNADAKTTDAELTQIAQRIAKVRIAVQPTVQVIYGEQELFNPDFFKQIDVKHTMPASLITWYQSDAGQWMNREIGSYFKNVEPLTAEQQYQQVKTAYQPMLSRVNLVSSQLHQQKSSLVFGSDTPSGPIYTQFPGLNGRAEMNHWVEMGISLKDLFKAMTIGNAKIMGLENEIGSVAKNKTADLLLLEKNPLIDISAYDSIHYVILKGKAIKREDLSALKIK